jgi:hypothetical protein
MQGMLMRRLNNENIKKIAKQVEDLLVKYLYAEQLFNSNAKTFKVLFDKWKLASDNQPRKYLDPSGNNGKDGYEYDKDEQEWSPIQTPKLPPNPALWEIEDKLCCHYVTLGIIRDMIYADKAKPIVKDILQGRKAKTDAFSFILYFIENANHKVYLDDSIELALSQVEQDLAKKPAETEQKATPARRRGIWTCVKRIPRWIYVLVIFLAALLTCIYFLWWLWTKFSA